jgi:hypothetical protein
MGSRSAHRWLATIGLAAIAAGALVMVLGMIEIGGLLNVAAGFLAVVAGSLLTMLNDRRGTFEDEFEQRLRDP